LHKLYVWMRWRSILEHSTCEVVLRLVIAWIRFEYLISPLYNTYLRLTGSLFMALRYNMGVTPSKKSLTLCDKLSVSSFCR
jgi:hypothetical protein